nr:protein PHYLLO, chloroplastic isoform X2 [Ipomoea batatas]
MNWFCYQPESSAVFPIIFLSKERDHPTYKSLALGRTHGVFGIGSAINFKGPSSATAGELSESGRYVSIDPKLIVAYEFFSIDSDKLLSFMKHEAGSDYFFVPQVILVLFLFIIIRYSFNLSCVQFICQTFFCCLFGFICN